MIEASLTRESNPEKVEAVADKLENQIWQEARSRDDYLQRLERKLARVANSRGQHAGTSPLPVQPGDKENGAAAAAAAFEPLQSQQQQQQQQQQYAPHQRLSPSALAPPLPQDQEQQQQQQQRQRQASQPPRQPPPQPAASRPPHSLPPPQPQALPVGAPQPASYHSQRTPSPGTLPWAGLPRAPSPGAHSAVLGRGGGATSPRPGTARVGGEAPAGGNSFTAPWSAYSHGSPGAHAGGWQSERRASAEQQYWQLVSRLRAGEDSASRRYMDNFLGALDAAASSGPAGAAKAPETFRARKAAELRASISEYIERLRERPPAERSGDGRGPPRGVADILRLGELYRAIQTEVLGRAGVGHKTGAGAEGAAAAAAGGGGVGGSATSSLEGGKAATASAAIMAAGGAPSSVERAAPLRSVYRGPALSLDLTHVREPTAITQPLLSRLAERLDGVPAVSVKRQAFAMALARLGGGEGDVLFPAALGVHKRRRIAEE